MDDCLEWPRFRGYTHARFLVSIKSNSREWYPKSVVSNSSTGEGMLVEE